MRGRLKAIEGERQTFLGEFVRFGLRSGYKGTEETVLLRAIQDTSGRFITGHLWFNLTKGFEKLSLKAGDKVQFDARVKSYTKGYNGRRYEVLHSAKAVKTTDFKLSHPTRILKLNH